ncbi:hypothetical protein AJ78_08424 [Emergomyces pasteurianus Ep9510]|uniref:Uncharacterized protein n=1 Tax=Emergomyces pasteurianus Ep9510 TaxID=1447872 RepID=A0A1J9Q636_9EURO|nr:hypothetical protein AJ78_08424 [Emergomyces pasteurianus Ep9510]
MGGTTVTYNHARPLAAERPIVTVMDDGSDSGSCSRTSPSSHTSRTSYTSTQSDYPHPAKRQRTDSYNLRQSKSWQEIGNPDVSSAPQIRTHRRLSFGQRSSPLCHVAAPAKERDIHSTIASKSDLFSFVKYPCDNNPIAVAIWLAQKIHNIKKNQSSHPRIPSLDPGALTNNASQRPKRRRNQAKNDSPLYPAGGFRLSSPGTFREFNSKHNCESQTAMDIEQAHEEQYLSGNSFSTKLFHSQMDLEARRIAPKLAKLKLFKPGFGDRLFDSMLNDHRIDADTAAAGKLLVSALVALTCPKPQSAYQAAADALIKALDPESPQSPRFTKALATLSNDPDVKKAAGVIVAQINTSDFAMGLDGEYDAYSGLSSYYNPNASHSPQCVNEKQTSIVARPLENHLEGPQCNPSTCSSISSSSCPSRHFLPENIITNASSGSVDNQSISVAENSLSSTMPPRHSNRVKKPTIRAIEAKLSSPANSSTKGQAPKALKRAEDKIIASTSKESSVRKTDMDATNKEASDTSDAVDLALAPPKRPLAASSIDKIASLARVDGLSRTARQPKRPFASHSVDQIAAAASLDKFMSARAAQPNLPKREPKTPRTTKSKASASVLSSSAPTLSPETNAMVEQLLGLATAASEFGFQPEVEIDLHRARRDWYAEQLAAALNQAATEKSLETDRAQSSQVAAAYESSLSSQPATSVTNDHLLETGGATPTTPTEDFALTVPSCPDSVAVTKDADASAGVAAALAFPSVQAIDAIERTNAYQPTTVENLVSDDCVESDVFRWLTSASDQTFLDSSVLSHSYLLRPWTDNDGWIHTGLGNEHNEEKVIVPDTYIWIRPRDTFNNPRIAPSPPKVKSLIQIELDDAFGYPPPGRKPNLPLELEGPFTTEDVAVEMEKAKVFLAAQIRGIIIDRSTPLNHIRLAIKKYDEVYAVEEVASSASDGNENSKGKALTKPSDTSAGTSRRTRASRKQTAGQPRGIVSPKREDDEPPVKLNTVTRNKKRRLNTDAPIPEWSSVDLDDGSGNLEATESIAVDSRPVLLVPRGPGRPSRRAAVTPTTAATRGTRQARQRSKSAPRQAQPKSIIPPVSGTVADGPVNASVTPDAKDIPSEKDAISITAQPEQI